MSMLLPTLLSLLQEYGYVALWGTIFCAAIGLPLPISFVLLGAGAFAALGDFNLALLAAIGISASVAGDSVGYYLGRRIGKRIFDWLEGQHKFRFLPSAAVTRSRVYFDKHGAWAIFLSRFLISGLGSPINLLAGSEAYGYRRFLLYDASGEALGTLIPLVLGFIFGASWEAIGDVLGTTSLLMLALLIALYFIFLLIRMSLRMKKEKKGKWVVSPVQVITIPEEEPNTLPL